MVSEAYRERVWDILFQYSLCRVVLMVMCFHTYDSRKTTFQYSLCRVVLMVGWLRIAQQFSHTVSVLALSSRFDGPTHSPAGEDRDSVSVLALSSRFDGRNKLTGPIPVELVSVLALSSRFDGPAESGIIASLELKFQYSLCRVVLMVLGGHRKAGRWLIVSVLALSSRFDGHRMDRPALLTNTVSVLALSSRFDGHS